MRKYTTFFSDAFPDVKPLRTFTGNALTVSLKSAIIPPVTFSIAR